VEARQSKQVRLLDRQAIPVTIVYGADLEANQPTATVPASLLLRTQNTAAKHLGLPLPSGRIAVFVTRGDEKLLQHESGIRDLAVDEEVEINMGDSPDVEVTAVKESRSENRSADRVDVHNARPMAIQFELRLRLPEGGRVVRPDHPMATKNGRPIFRLTVPANQTMTLRYQWEHVTG